MYWLFLLLSLGCFAFAIKTPSTGMMLLWLGGALLFLLAWIRGRYVATFGESQSTVPPMIDPAELRRLREQAQARRDAAQERSNDFPEDP
jgi:hypothetical protein